MNLIEKVLAKLDELRKKACTHNEMCLDDEYACYSCIVNFSLRRQVAKHQKVYDSIADSVHDNNPLCDCGSSIYPCTFIKEVAHDLGISE
jgi:hypothetical protein